MKKTLIVNEVGYICNKCKVEKKYTDSFGYINNYCNTCGSELNWNEVMSNNDLKENENE